MNVVITETVAGWRLDRALAELLRGCCSRAVLQRLIRAGAVTHHGLPVYQPDQLVTVGDTFQVEQQPAPPMQALPEAMSLQIVFEDQFLLVIDKPAGLVVHPGAGNHSGTLVNGLLHHCTTEALSTVGGAFRPGIVHRLDKDTSGLLVVAKQDQAHQSLAQQFHDHTAFRYYRAIVYGQLPQSQGTIDAPIGRHPGNRLKMAVVSQPHGRHAVTHYRCLEYFPGPPGSRGLTSIRCRLETGRTHQIRVHLAHHGFPVWGDPLYGWHDPLPAHGAQPLRQLLIGFQRQALHAAVLELTHPVTGERLRFKSPLPADFQALLAGLRDLSV
ncbi:MAG: RluA family pseudouridine synthase [Magnetococcales bacterium]|nr:RluA family pseudouridine synthase [Magnetococcales bacterium]